MSVLTIGIFLDCFYLPIVYSEKFSTWVWRFPFAVNVNLNLSILTINIRSYNRSRSQPQAQGLRGSIETAKCANFRTNCAPLNVTNSRVPREFARLSCGFRETGDRFATLFECSLDFPSASYLDRQCMHSGRMSQCYINIIRNKYIAKNSRGLNDPAVRIKENKPRGKIWLITKTKKKSGLLDIISAVFRKDFLCSWKPLFFSTR